MSAAGTGLRAARFWLTDEAAGSGDHSSDTLLAEVNSASEMVKVLVGFQADEFAWPLLPKIGRPIKPRVRNTRIPDLERRMIEEFRWRALPHTHGTVSDNFWEWLALAQHYGMPTRLLVVQSGWFTVHKWISKQERFIPLESNAKYKKKIFKILVPQRSFGSIREELVRLDIHNASMFPDLGGLGAHIKWLHIRDQDE